VSIMEIIVVVAVGGYVVWRVRHVIERMSR